MKIKVGFKKVFDAYKALEPQTAIEKQQAAEILAIEKEYPKLTTGLTKCTDLTEYQTQIDAVLNPLFSPLLTENEIKFATIPFQNIAIKCTQRYKNLIKAAGEKVALEIINFNADQFYIMGCSIILNIYYGIKVDFRRSYYYNIPDEHGMVKNYRLLYNADFVEIQKTNKAKDISEADINELLESYENVAIWKEKFPPESWIFNGFVIASLTDVTLNVSISDFKSNLLRLEKNGGFEDTEFSRIFRSIFHLKDLMIGFTDYHEETETFERTLFKEISSFILNNKKSQRCKDALCSGSYYKLFKQREFYCITDAERYHKLYPDNLLYKKMLDQGMKSAIFASIVHEDKILGVLELVSPNANDLNTINANKLRDIMPFLIDSVVRSKENLENELELIIQEECTAIHSSVHWKFRQEAKRYLNSKNEGNANYFREIVFQDVFPLYGQTDIKGSSEARNEATKQDLMLQLQYIDELLQKLSKYNPLLIFEQMKFTVANFSNEITENLQVDTERKVIDFIASEIIPFFKHMRLKNNTHKKWIDEYNELVDLNSGLVYKFRKDYDESVMQTNKRLAAILDRKQLEAQQMYPHYFERFNTDGVEHNMYIGENITKRRTFNKLYLKNLRLWQLQIVCEMENSFYNFKESLPVNLDVASMILVFNGSLSLRFRMDEKRFDVDGTYNARYEVVKKRVDKAHIKGTEERITQPGKIVMVYSQKEDEEEYLQYIKFLQSQKMLDEGVEILELEDLQGVTGLKALRVKVLYSKNTNKTKEYYTYEDLISELKD
ncbi:GAF domain-containing protein [Aequorivita marisscotiae]|uniref:GAF domain-containing protein n=1 Tax=Aequorivita marisscotiae TaxID=3040348 RepID=A0ABY8KS09_9FLAO|nr:GAF domain-containing protein [Aequorivita sp. Ant34-E75]WGF92239.1 GAF domain-containing protein [Aequorivita sp. Ant34-E75]